MTGIGDQLRLSFCHSLELFDWAGAVDFVELFQAALRELAPVRAGSAHERPELAG